MEPLGQRWETSFCPRTHVNSTGGTRILKNKDHQERMIVVSPPPCKSVFSEDFNILNTSWCLKLPNGLLINPYLGSKVKIWCFRSDLCLFGSGSSSVYNRKNRVVQKRPCKRRGEHTGTCRKPMVQVLQLLSGDHLQGPLFSTDEVMGLETDWRFLDLTLQWEETISKKRDLWIVLLLFCLSTVALLEKKKNNSNGAWREKTCW